MNFRFVLWVFTGIFSLGLALAIASDKVLGIKTTPFDNFGPAEAWSFGGSPDSLSFSEEVESESESLYSTREVFPWAGEEEFLWPILFTVTIAWFAAWFTIPLPLLNIFWTALTCKTCTGSWVPAMMSCWELGTLVMSCWELGLTNTELVAVLLFTSCGSTK